MNLAGAGGGALVAGSFFFLGTWHGESQGLLKTPASRWPAPQSDARREQRKLSEFGRASDVKLADEKNGSFPSLEAQAAKRLSPSHFEPRQTAPKTHGALHSREATLEAIELFDSKKLPPQQIICKKHGIRVVVL